MFMPSGCGSTSAARLASTPTVLGAAGFADGIQELTPFYWGEATEILKGNARWQPAVVFLALFAGFVAMAALAFERRDIAVGGWSPRAALRRVSTHGQRRAEAEASGARHLAGSP